MLEFNLGNTYERSFASDLSNFYCGTSDGFFKISVDGVKQIRERIYQKSVAVNLEKNLVLIGSKSTIENGEMRDQAHKDHDPWLFLPHLYRNAYRSRNYFVSKLSLSNKEPKLLLPLEILKEGQRIGRGIFIYNIRSGVYKMLEMPGSISYVAISLDETMFAAVVRVKQEVIVRIYDNDLL